MHTNVYIDGFNLYHRAVKGTPYKWLDLYKLSQSLAPSHQINRIRYFTALLHPRPDDLAQVQRQLTYIRALGTIPGLTVHYGQFRERIKWGPLVNPVLGGAQIVAIKSFEEKGSDVNLATYLLVDAFDRDYEQALVISNDSDLAFPINLVSQKLGLSVGVVNPNLKVKGNWVPTELLQAATFTRQLRESALKKSQFPVTLRDAQGIITKPPNW